jgi:VIT1/CCC1 family predicted Fe2+/Mn2+ transporter
MYKLSFVMVLGVLVFLTPFLGLPSGHQLVLLCVLGVSIFFTAYTIRKSMKSQPEMSSVEHVTPMPVSDLITPFDQP